MPFWIKKSDWCIDCGDFSIAKISVTKEATLYEVWDKKKNGKVEAFNFSKKPPKIAVCIARFDFGPDVDGPRKTKAFRDAKKLVEERSGVPL